MVRETAFKHCVLQRLLYFLYRADHLEQNLSRVLEKRFKLAFIASIKKKSTSPTGLPKRPALSRWFQERARSKEAVCQGLMGRTRLLCQGQWDRSRGSGAEAEGAGGSGAVWV